MFINHTITITATEANQMAKAAKLATGLGIEAHGLIPSIGSVCTWIVRGWDRHNETTRAVVINTITKEARDATLDEIENGVVAI